MIRVAGLNTDTIVIGKHPCRTDLGNRIAAEFNYAL
jgi:hypothetical protein